MTTSATSISRRHLDRIRAEAYWRAGQAMHELLRISPRGKARTEAARLAVRTSYGSRWLYMLARLPLAYSRRRYRELARELDPGVLVLIAQLRSPTDRGEVLREVLRRPMSYRQVEQLVSQRQARRKGHPCNRRRRKPRPR